MKIGFGYLINNTNNENNQNNINCQIIIIQLSNKIKLSINIINEIPNWMNTLPMSYH
jgi:hypothetical protein